MADPVPYLIATRSDRPDGREKDGRPSIKILTASILRNIPTAEVKVVRELERPEDWKPLFRVERAGMEERAGGTSVETGGASGPWRTVACLERVEEYPWLLFLDSGSLLLRGVDHLLAGDADILWAPLAGVPVTEERCGAFLTDEERKPDYRAERPHSRPWREAASSAVWAVRGEHVRAVMAEWKKITRAGTEKADTGHVHLADGTCCGGRDRSGSNGNAAKRTIESAWNRLLIDTPLRVARFERDEVQFPSLPGTDFLRWKDAAILNVSDWPPDAQSKFLQAWFYGTYFADPTGLFLDIVEP